MKQLSFSLLALLCAGLMTACHDDDDDENGNDEDTITVVDMTNATVTDPKLSLGATLGVYTFEWSEAGGMLTPSNISTYEFSTSTTMGDSDGFYGGIRPTWFSADCDSVVFTPASGSFKSGNGCLVANQGNICKAIFRQGLLTAKRKIKGMYVSSTWYINETAKEGDTEEGFAFPALEKGDYIKVQVWGYDVDITKPSSITGIFTNLQNSTKGKKAANSITLASNNGEKCDVLEDWTWYDLSDLQDCELFEVDIESNREDLTDAMKTVLIDDITFVGGVF